MSDSETIGSGLPVDVFFFKLGTQLSTGMDVKFLRKTSWSDLPPRC